MLFTSLKFLHLLSLIALFASNLAKNFLVAPSRVPSRNILLCRAADRASGAAAGVVVLTGLGLLQFSPKGSSFYTSNSLFWLKILVLVLASALIIRTKIFFRKHANAAPSISVDVPGAMSKILKFDFVSLLVITYLAVLVVNGIGPRL
jgi:putative membrane protein